MPEIAESLRQKQGHEVSGPSGTQIMTSTTPEELYCIKSIVLTLIDGFQLLMLAVGTLNA